jgi:hypothetical protein
MATLYGKLTTRRPDCAAVAGNSPLNRLELSREVATRNPKISHDPAAIERLFVDLFLDAQAKTPEQITPGLGAGDGHWNGRVFQGC